MRPVPLFQNQFILGPEAIVATGECRHVAVGPGLVLSAHPSLLVERASSAGGEKSLTLLGYMLDPDNPVADDRGILRGLLAKMGCADDAPGLTAGLGGRWALVVRDARQTLLFHDAGGMRQVHFASRDGVTWCGTRAETVAEVSGCEIDPLAAAYARSADFVFLRYGRWWPGDGALHRGVRRLLPNHRLDLGNGTVARYWPDEDIAPISRDQGIETGAAILSGMMRAAVARFRLVLLLTGGRDSRLVLAASRGICHEMGCVSISKSGASDPDARIPGQMLASLGLTHHIVESRGRPTRRFWRAYRENSPHGNRSYAANAEAVAPRLGPDRAAVWGNMAEIIKCPDRLYGKHLRGRPSDSATARDLVKMTRHGRHPYAERAMSGWLAGARDRRNVGLLDLLYWEQRVGSWLAGWVNEYDPIWQEWVCPFNCRRLLVTLLGVDPAFRGPPAHQLHSGLIERLWPKLLSAPFCGRRAPSKGFVSRLRNLPRNLAVGCYRRIFG